MELFKKKLVNRVQVSRFFFCTMLSSCYLQRDISYIRIDVFRVEIGIPKSQNYPYYDQCHQRDLDFAVLEHRKDIRSIEWKVNKTMDCSQWEYNYTQIPYASIAAEVKYTLNASLTSCVQNIWKIRRENRDSRVSSLAKQSCD